MPHLSAAPRSRRRAAGTSSPVTVRSATFHLVRIPSGEFQMCSENAGEGPHHRVRVRSLDIGRSEVTVGQFRTFTWAAGYRTDAEKDPGPVAPRNRRPPVGAAAGTGRGGRKQAGTIPASCSPKIGDRELPQLLYSASCPVIRGKYGESSLAPTSGFYSPRIFFTIGA